MGQANRTTFNISLRMDDPFERRLSACLRRMPRGYGKMFFHRVARLFGRDCESDDEMYQLMLDFCFDVKPVRLGEMPAVAAAAERSKVAVAAEAVAQVSRPLRRQARLFEGDDLGIDLKGGAAARG